MPQGLSKSLTELHVTMSRKKATNMESGSVKNRSPVDSLKVSKYSTCCPDPSQLGLTDVVAPVNYDRIMSNHEKSSPITSTIRGSEHARVTATSFMELSVGLTCDTRRVRSEPGSLATTVITGSRTSGIEERPANLQSRIASLDGLDAFAARQSAAPGGIGSCQSSQANAPAGDVTALAKSRITSMWERNANGDNEPDYVVDPVQGNAYHKGPFLGKVRLLIQDSGGRLGDSFFKLSFFRILWLMAFSI